MPNVVMNDGTRSPVVIIRPESSHIEMTLVGKVSELGAEARKLILASANAQHIAPPRDFAISDMMVQMITRDSRLKLVSNSYVDDLSGTVQPVDRSEELFRRFVTYLNAISAKQAIPRGRVAAAATSSPAGR